MPETLTVAVCVYAGVTLSDFIPNTEILAGLNDADDPVIGKELVEVPFRLKFEYLSPTLDPVVSIRGKCAPTFNPTTTYAAAMGSGTQYDIIFVPADFESGEHKVPEGFIPFISTQAPKAKYILSLCGGASYLAFAAATPKDIQWVAKARWVVDGNVWTSSGVTAGSDMLLAFIEHLVGPRAARFLRGAVEIREATQEADPFAEFHGLV
ncbi:class I glutamine amidotransferase-like protein [Mycena olivaceomarginata]|nr:class I glutamine amidotransferase-like protein [Mycena olivaceomarginata]